MTIRTKESRTEADPNFRSDTQSPSVKRSRPQFGFGFHGPVFDGLRVDNTNIPAFKPRNDAPLVMGTPARTLASYVVYQNHLSMVADYPSAYRGHPGLPALAAIPTTWDDTKVPDAKVGEYVVLARRSSREWHVGAMTDGKARTVRVPLGFLGPGRFTAESWRDDTTAKFGLTRRDLNVTDTDSLTLDLHAGGGAYVRIVPAK